MCISINFSNQARTQQKEKNNKVAKITLVIG